MNFTRLVSFIFELEPVFLLGNFISFSLATPLVVTSVAIGIVCLCRRSRRVDDDDDLRCGVVVSLTAVVPKLSEILFMGVAEIPLPRLLADVEVFADVCSSRRLSAVTLRFISSTLFALEICSRECRWWWWWWWWRFLRRPLPLTPLPESNETFDTLDGRVTLTFCECACCCCGCCWDAGTSIRHMLLGLRDGAPFFYYLLIILN